MSSRKPRSAWIAALVVTLLLSGCEPGPDEGGATSDPSDAPADRDDDGSDAAGGSDPDGSPDTDASSGDDTGSGRDPDQDLAGDDFDVAAYDPSLIPDPDCFGIEPRGIDAVAITCGTVEVPLHYDDPDGATIHVAVARIAMDGPDASQPPLVVLGGGPGEVMIAPFLTEPLVRQLFAVQRDLLIIDQRGVGSSRPALACPEVSEVDIQDAATQDVEAALTAVDACHTRLTAEGIDLGGFNHLANARDIEVVRAALGSDRVDIRGTSYGTQLALLTAGLYPDSVRSLTLSSPLDPRVNWVEQVGGGLEDALDRVIDVCALADGCSQRTGDLRAAITEVVADLDDQPREVTVQPPQGEQTTVTYHPSTFLDGLFTLFYLPDGVALLPALVDRAREGDLTPLAQIVAALEQALDDGVTTGMQFSMLCSAEAAVADTDVSLAGLESPLLREYWFPSSLLGGAVTPQLCDAWPVAPAYAPGDVALPTPVPTLLVTGAFDHVTPPRYGQDLHAALTTSHLIQVADAGHGPLESLDACGRGIVAAFLAEPTRTPDTSCAAASKVRFLPRLPNLG